MNGDLRQVSHAGRVDAVGLAPGAILPAVIERMSRPSRPLAILLIVGGIVGLIAAFALTLDKFEVLLHPNAVLNCNISVLVQCGEEPGRPAGVRVRLPEPAARAR